MTWVSHALRSPWELSCFGIMISTPFPLTTELSTNSLGGVFWNYDFQSVFHTAGLSTNSWWILWCLRIMISTQFSTQRSFNQFPGGFCGVLEFYFPHSFPHSGAFNQLPGDFVVCRNYDFHTVSTQRSFQPTPWGVSWCSGVVIACLFVCFFACLRILCLFGWLMACHHHHDHRHHFAAAGPYYSSELLSLHTSCGHRPIFAFANNNHYDDAHSRHHHHRP